jgi:hypothetical protein
MRRETRTEDDVEDDVAAGARDWLPGVDHLLLELVKKGIVFHLLLGLATLPLHSLALFLHLNY